MSYELWVDPYFVLQCMASLCKYLGINFLEAKTEVEGMTIV